MIVSRWTTQLIAGFLLAIASFSACMAEQRRVEMTEEVDRQYSAAEQSAWKNVSITFMSASSPVGRFLLIRNKKDVCAVRFTEFHRGRDSKPPTIFDSGDETIHAEYDWFYQGDGSGEFAKSNVKSGHSQLKKGALVGIGRLSMQLGTSAIACGPFSLRWTYPTQVGFHLSNSKKDDIGNELAPTKWKDIKEVNINDPRLKWYRFDEKRKPTYI